MFKSVRELQVVRNLPEMDNSGLSSEIFSGKFDSKFSHHLSASAIVSIEACYNMFLARCNTLRSFYCRFQALHTACLRYETAIVLCSIFMKLTSMDTLILWR